MADQKLSTAMVDSSSIESDAKVDASNEPTPAQLALEISARRKIDLVLIPTVTMFYLLSFLDRTNIGNARVAGMQRDLKLIDHEYQVAITVLYVPYILTELPANLLLKKIGPHILLPTILVLWGVVVIAHGFVTNYAGLIALRVVLGALEGPMFPGIVLYLSGFYTRKDLSLRIAYFFSAASLSGAFSGLLAAAISGMEGVGGKKGWEWIFILEGLFTTLFGLVSFWLVPQTTEGVRMLSRGEKDATTRRLERDRPFLLMDEKFRPAEIWNALTSVHVFLIFVLFFLGGSIFFAFALFLPSIIRQMQFSPLESQLLSVGPFAAAFFVSLFVAWFSDKYNSRGVPTMVLCSMLTVGWGMFYAAPNTWVAYGSFFLMVPGVYASSPIASAWLANNSEPYFRRASSIALAFMATNAGGILSTWRFPTSEGPRFQKTTIMNTIFSFIMVMCAVSNIFLLKWLQKRKEQNRDKLLEPFLADKEHDGGKKAWLVLGDRHPDFKYTL
ncbi:MFS general substrate transporter [Coprinopsis marcescibilis]|uniref:MFS general substrate transporter n=1 Tax=Coprinopsis marcescibilis TaxID=230819 RepID=A0A5C3KXZ7_COPMA|nr:MFS general substrate transporter [Coprinopsis marcescibilis]